MKQSGIVVAKNGNIAKIECDRRSACDMCENVASCAEKCKKVYASALDTVGASIGDVVEIETDTSGVLLNAVIVFLLPIIIAVGAYFVSDMFFSEGVSVLITFAVLVFSMCLFSFLLNKAAKRKTVSRITRIL